MTSATAIRRPSPERIKYRRPWVYDKQRAAIFNESRYSVIEATTKSGKTAGCIAWLAEQAMKGHEGLNYWWIAPVFAQAKIAYRRLRRALHRAQKRLIANGYMRPLYKANDTELSVTLANGAMIWFKSGEKPDHLYGEDVYAAVIDEASRLREEAWHAVRSTLTATRGPIRIIGNVKGRKNWAYRMARRAQSGESGMEYHKITAYDAATAGEEARAKGIKNNLPTMEEIEDAKRQLPEAVFNELYLAEPSDDGGNPFGLGAIERCVIPRLTSKDPTCWAWDLAKSTDWTVGIALDEDGKACRFERWNKTVLPEGVVGDYWEFTQDRIVKVTNGVAAIVESNGIGDPVVEGIQRKARAQGQSNFEPFLTTSTSKQQIMEGLAVGIQQNIVGFPDGPIRDELEEFEYVYTRRGVTYSAPEGLHDDCVMTLAMVFALWDATPTPEGVAVYDQHVSISPV
jgi:hypothetical protein